jgi:hypothetical protein
MISLSNEARIVTAIQALQNDSKLSVRAAARIYNVAEATLRTRRAGVTARRDTIPNSRLLTPSEERAIVKYILDLDSKGFPPRLRGVEDMANRLLAERGGRRVGVRWAKNFVQRQPELSTRLTRKYDYQRAQCEDPVIIRTWFNLVKNTIAKYGIVEDDIYNFDETGFMMGIISTAMVVTSSERRGKAKAIQPGNREWVTVIQGVNALGWAVPPFIVVKGQFHLQSWYENGQLQPDWRVATSDNGWTTNEIGLDWIKHFDKYTATRKTSAFRLLILDGHESHHSTEFELYCKENDIITLCMPPHSSHLLQPLDVGCFSPLKKAYGSQIEELMRNGQTHITKDDFFPAFRAAFKRAITAENIKGGFRGAGIIPMNPEQVITQLTLYLKTPTPPNSRPGSSHSWVSKTPQNPIEATSQSAFIKGRISRHHSSSPTPIVDALEQLTKGSMAVMHEVALLRAQVRGLKAANEELSKRRRAKKIRLRKGGSLSAQEAQELKDEIEVAEQIKVEERANGGRARRTEVRARRCGNCGNTGHNARTCQEIIETSEEEDSE